jgi:hypothetical protein
MNILNATELTAKELMELTFGWDSRMQKISMRTVGELK